MSRNLPFQAPHRCARRGLTLRLIEPGKPNHNAYIESFKGRFRDECLNEHWFTSLAHAQVVLESWRREYNDERRKKGLGGLTPAAFALQLTADTKTTKVTARFSTDPLLKAGGRRSRRVREELSYEAAECLGKSGRFTLAKGKVA